MGTIWNQAPALLYGLAFMLGCFSAIAWNPIILLPILCLFAPLFSTERSERKVMLVKLMLAAILMLLAFSYIKATIKFPAESEKKEFAGRAIFKIGDLSLLKKYHGKYANFKGSIAAFLENGTIIAKNIPSSVLVSHELAVPSADSDYQIQGKLKRIDHHKYLLVPDKDSPWIPLKNSWSLAQFRFQMKNYVSEYIHRHIEHRRSADFLSGLATSNFDDRMMVQELGRFGLQHIMAISGFHFAIVTTILGLLLHFILPRRLSGIMLMILITFYFIFLGCGPSILRAWLTSLIGLFSVLIERKANALNSLGIALLAILGFDPLLCEHIGFQFSFACTAAILLLYSPCDDLMQKIFPMRALKITSKMSLLSQHAYCFLHFCRSAASLGMAINLAALPLTFYYFQKFPLPGLLYNLFFPFMVSISIILLMVGILTSVIMPPLGGLIHSLNSSYTHFILNYAYNMPINFDLVLRSELFTAELVIVLFLTVFTGGIFYRNLGQNDRSLIFLT